MSQEIVDAAYQAKPGHYQDVVTKVSDFYLGYIHERPLLASYTITGDEGSGEVRAFVTWETREAASALNSDPKFAEFADDVSQHMTGPPVRILLEILHTHTR
ncbi:MAG: hypothetical protein WCI26_08050 [Acidimicrobiales bacterium]